MKTLLSVIFLSLLGVSTLSYASCQTDITGGWHCFDKNSTSSTGDCKDMKCPGGCVEAMNGKYGHCCSEPTQTDCRGDIYSEGCLSRTKIECLPSQYCDKDGTCKNN